MKLLETRYAPLMTAGWMIGVPLVLAFFAGAGAGTVFDPLAAFAGTVFSIFGGASLILGAALLLWTLWSAWRAGELTASKELNG
ncbi:hypothetical protein GV827_05055 [Sulfitobacter sp. JBTF-M27]|uniref:Uncharacterized protein n=1 Tax=Sulfitobacter sediminilitoris TaxID=2698830 RepID=A0A6P0C9F9_9RHOB|nr:hypothetical protein [Sulfitobacter sediminilitoris]NEK21768.1 hypothetical protein [Sulfitobacter sediminilitoris]